MPIHIGKRIRILRQQKGWSQRELARRVNLNASVMNRIELGTRQINVEELTRFAEVFQTSSDWLLGRTEHPASPAKEKGDPLTDLPEDLQSFLGDYYKLSNEDQYQIARLTRALLKLSEEEND